MSKQRWEVRRSTKPEDAKLLNMPDWKCYSRRNDGNWSICTVPDDEGDFHPVAEALAVFGIGGGRVTIGDAEDKLPNALAQGKRVENGLRGFLLGLRGGISVDNQQQRGEQSV